MNFSVPFNSNPLASNADTPIPFNITRPAAARRLIISDEPTLVELPDQVNLIIVVADKPFTLVDGAEAVVEDDWEVGAFHADADIYYNLIVGPSILLSSLEGAEVIINRQVIWSALANLGTYIRS